MKQIGHTARQFCKYMQRNSEFLEFSPAQHAAAALVLSLNLCYSVVCDSIGLTRLGDQYIVKETPCEVAANDTEEFPAIKKDEEIEDPLALWTEKLTSVTQLSAKKDISSVYC